MRSMLPQTTQDQIKTHIKFVQHKFKKRKLFTESAKNSFGDELQLSKYQADPSIFDFNVEDYQIRKYSILNRSYFEKCVQNPISQLLISQQGDNYLGLLMLEIKTSCRYFGNYEIAFQVFSFMLVLIISVCNFVIFYNDENRITDRVTDAKVTLVILIFITRLAYSVSVMRVFLYLSYVLGCTIVVMDVTLLKLVKIEDQSVNFIVIFVLEMGVTILYSAIVIWTVTQQEKTIQYIRVLLGQRYEQYFN